MNRWLGFRLDMLSTTVVAATSILGVALKGHIDEGLLGLALVYTLSLSGVFQFMVSQPSQPILPQPLLLSAPALFVNRIPPTLLGSCRCCD